MTPFLKWAGGKRWLAPALKRLLAECSTRYVEPFLGSGAVFFALGARRAWLCDVNPELIATFGIVKERVEDLIASLSTLDVDRNVYKVLAAQRSSDPLQRATRLIYLNRTAFNGIYRVNLQGHFNVPFGCKPGTKILDELGLRKCSAALQAASLSELDYRDSLERIREDDWVYIDPPYTVNHDSNGFRRYNERLFSWKDQEHLARWASSFAQGGGRVVVSNAMHPEVLALYQHSCFTALTVERASNMAAANQYRGTRQELLLVSKAIVPDEAWAERPLGKNLPYPVDDLTGER